MDENTEKLLTTPELADKLSVPVSWCYAKSRMRGPNTIPKIMCGKYIRYRISDVLRWLQEQQDGDG